MIRESLYFSFDGVKSINYPIVNVNVGDGLYEEAIASSKSINESSMINRQPIMILLTKKFIVSPFDSPAILTKRLRSVALRPYLSIRFAFYKSICAYK